MNAIEAFASAALQFALERSVVFTIVLLVMACAWWLLKSHSNSHVGSVWFLIPLVVLVVPLERWIPNPWSASNPIERAALSILPPQKERTFIDPNTEGFLEFRPQSTAIARKAAADSGAAASHPTPIPWAVWLFSVWLLCMLTFLIRLVLGQGRMQAWLRSARVLDPKSLSVNWVRVQRSSGVSRPTLMLESPEFDSPVLWTGRLPGALRGPGKTKYRAAIILPEGLSERLSSSELRWVLLHELAHLARGDHRTELVQRILGAAFVFHPLVWVANRISRSYREMACDDAALARCAESERKRCARALFEVVSHAASLAKQPDRLSHRTTHAMSSLFESKKLTRRRIMRLIELDRPLARGLRLSAILPLLFVSGVALAAARFPAVLQGEETIEDHFEEIVRDDESPASADVTKATVRRATDWLLANQNKDGGWSDSEPSKENAKEWAAGFNTPGVKEPDLNSFQRYHNDVALTALALQALIERVRVEGSTPALTRSIDQAVGYLLAQQNEKTGQFGPDDFTVMVGQALATEAIALAMKDRITTEVLERLRASVRLLERARNPYQGWRYDLMPTGDNDARITGYVLLALTRAFEIGAQAGYQTIEEAMIYLYHQEDSETGRTHYMQGQPYALRLLSHKESHPAERAEVPTAMLLRLRNHFRQKDRPGGVISKSIDLLISKAPLWDLEKGTIDYTYWWQGTAALVHSEVAATHWPIWRDKVRTILNEHQITVGPLAGTWPTVDAWSAPGLEVYTTATCALALYATLEDR